MADANAVCDALGVARVDWHALLRPHQRLAYVGMERGRRGLAHMWCGTGKTMVFSAKVFMK